MCWGCRPTCDNCKPPLYFYVQCPTCNYPYQVTREDYLILMGYPYKRTAEEKALTSDQIAQSMVCSHCGQSLVKQIEGLIEPKPCIRSNIVCGYPCGQRDSKYEEERKRCDKMVPLERLDSIEL